MALRDIEGDRPLGNHPFSTSCRHHDPSSYRARAARAATPTQLATILPAPEEAADEEVELLEELVPVAVPVALPLAGADEPVAEADEEPELDVAVAVALAEPLLAVDEAVPVESAPVLDAVDEPDAVEDADAEEEEDEPSVMLNWFYRRASISAHDSFYQDLNPGFLKLTDWA